MGKFNIDEMNEFLETQFSNIKNIGKIISLGDKSAVLMLEVNESHLRPGATISGPTMMGVADVCMYVAILNEIGPVVQAVTTNLNINFLLRPIADNPIVAKAKILKLGKRLAVGEVSIYSHGHDDIVAHVTLTYSIPKHDLG